MKRKIKVFSAIASLCLAVALMAFGVYAATNVTYTLSGSVTYTANDVLVDVTTTISYVTDSKVGYSSLENVKGLTYAGVGPTVDAYKNYNDTTKLPEEGKENFSKEGIAVNFNTSTAWRIEVIVSTPQTTNGLTITDHTTYLAEETEANENYLFVKATDNAATVNPGGAGTQVKLYYYLFLLDPTEAATGTFTISLEFKRAA